MFSWILYSCHWRAFLCQVVLIEKLIKLLQKLKNERVRLLVWYGLVELLNQSMYLGIEMEKTKKTKVKFTFFRFDGSQIPNSLGLLLLPISMQIFISWSCLNKRQSCTCTQSHKGKRVCHCLVSKGKGKAQVRPTTVKGIITSTPNGMLCILVSTST